MRTGRSRPLAAQVHISSGAAVGKNGRTCWFHAVPARCSLYIHVWHLRMSSKCLEEQRVRLDLCTTDPSRIPKRISKRVSKRCEDSSHAWVVQPDTKPTKASGFVYFSIRTWALQHTNIYMHIYIYNIYMCIYIYKI